MRTFSLSWTTSILRPQFRTALAQRMTATRTRVWNRACARRGWLNWDPRSGTQSMKVLGTPVGSTRFVEEVVNKRLEEEAKLRETIPFVPDPAMCGSTLPPHVADSPAIPVRRMCAGTRCRDVASDGHTWHSPATHKRLKWRTTLHLCRLVGAQKMAPAAYWAMDRRAAHD